ncbi:hypothetical protein KIN20_005649 [Parelaphostrongylus tenuis]|uniref:Uncharacterized protein n=1 Tax=Parelaphostrongylus tenuis TaxID=148309 RepID=A0AAD5MT33_PARTN|nr:hypothetical protein KIN20_005649 [Parelaphostrongylus tenuis]
MLPKLWPTMLDLSGRGGGATELTELFITLAWCYHEFRKFDGSIGPSDGIFEL